MVTSVRQFMELHGRFIFGRFWNSNKSTSIKKASFNESFYFFNKQSLRVCLINPNLQNKVLMRKACQADPPRGTWTRTFVGEDRGIIPAGYPPTAFHCLTRQPHKTITPLILRPYLSTLTKALLSHGKLQCIGWNNAGVTWTLIHSKHGPPLFALHL